jgi:hypothetical protein
MVVVILGGIFAVLAVFLVITLVLGDDSARGGAGRPESKLVAIH